ncbi:hypothetical protein JDV09_24320 [Mycobacterium sp. Y57]|nr:hypothetical protein [Mycolicibacterium xanthum]
MLAVPACTAQTAESAASPQDFTQCLIDHGVPADAATPPQGPPPGADGAPQGPPPGGEAGPPPGRPGSGDRPAPPAPSGVDEATWNDAFTACAEVAPGPPPGHPGPPAA